MLRRVRAQGGRGRRCSARESAGAGWGERRRRAEDRTGAGRWIAPAQSRAPAISISLCPCPPPPFSSAVTHTSPALLPTRPRLSLPLFAGAICRAAPALFFVHSRRHPWHCANESAGVTGRGALIKHGESANPVRVGAPEKGE